MHRTAAEEQRIEMVLFNEMDELFTKLTDKQINLYKYFL